jgi:uncharacterized membrane protein YphA (DoxX/SURF4 family)
MSQTDVTVPEAKPAGDAPAQKPSRVARWIEELVPRICGLVFLYAGVGKALDRSRTHRVFAFDHVPEALIVPLTHAVWVGEVVLALLLLLGIARRRVVMATVLVLFVYSVQLAILIAAQNPPKCSCVNLFEQYASAKQVLMLGLVRNAVMAASLEWVRLRIVGRALTAARAARATKEDG